MARHWKIDSIVERRRTIFEAIAVTKERFQIRKNNIHVEMEIVSKVDRTSTFLPYVYIWLERIYGSI